MANSYNTSQTSIPSGQAGNDITVFTASASTTLIKSVRVVHASGTSSATLSITKSGGGTRSDMNTVALTAGILTDLIDDVLPLQSGDILKVRTSHVPSEVFVSYVENTTAVQGQSIDVLADVDTTTVLPTNGQVLVWDGNQWEPGTVAAGAAALDDLTDVSAASPTPGDVIEWNGSFWVTTDKVNALYEKLKTTSGTQLYNTSLNTNQGYLDLQSTSGKLGLKQTFFNVSQTSPGVLKLTVGAGAAGAETSFDAVIVSGTTSAGSATALFRSGTQLLIEDAGGFNQWLRGSSSSTADTTVQMPDSSGQLALTSQIPTVPVNSVNSQTGAVVLDADDISDATTTNKFATAAELAKLAGIAAGAEVNVNADWNAVSGDAQILNKPTIPSATSDLTNDSGFVTSNLGSADQTISASTTRKINLGTSGALVVASGSSNNVQAMRIVGSSGTATIEFTGTVKMDSGTMAGGSIRLEEFGGGGQSAVTLKAPTYLSADVSFVLPDADGTNGQALVTDGLGNLSFTTISGGGGGGLGSADQTLTGDRLIDTNGYNLAIELDPTGTPDTFTIHDGTHDLFQVDTNTTGTLFSVNDVSGLPMFQSNSDGTMALPQILTAAPTGTATEGTMQLAIVSGTCYLYVYINGGWKSTTLT